MAPLTIRPATPSDGKTVARLVRNLARYERLEHEVISTPESFTRILNDPARKVEILLAEIEDQAIGFALFSRISRRSSGSRVFTLRTFSLSPNSADRVLAPPCSTNCFGLPAPGNTDASNGMCWSGTNRPSNFIRRNWVRNCWWTGGCAES